MVALLRDAEQQRVAGDHPRRLLNLTGSAHAQPPDAAERPTPSLALPLPLTERELQVLRLLGTELSGPEIARELFVSFNTVRTHTKHIFTKLDVSDRRAAVRRARESGLM
jgi:LuxR family transcriptional regulator, maltose regulon positive regulatory protein